MFVSFKCKLAVPKCRCATDGGARFQLNWLLCVCEWGEAIIFIVPTTTIVIRKSAGLAEHENGWMNWVGLLGWCASLQCGWNLEWNGWVGVEGWRRCMEVCCSLLFRCFQCFLSEWMNEYGHHIWMGDWNGMDGGEQSVRPTGLLTASRAILPIHCRHIWLIRRRNVWWRKRRHRMPLPLLVDEQQAQVRNEWGTQRVIPLLHFRFQSIQRFFALCHPCKKCHFWLAAIHLNFHSNFLVFVFFFWIPNSLKQKKVGRPHYGKIKQRGKMDESIIIFVCSFLPSSSPRHSMLRLNEIFWPSECVCLPSCFWHFPIIDSHILLT